MLKASTLPPRLRRYGSPIGGFSFAFADCWFTEILNAQGPSPKLATQFGQHPQVAEEALRFRPDRQYTVQACNEFRSFEKGQREGCSFFPEILRMFSAVPYCLLGFQVCVGGCCYSYSCSYSCSCYLHYYHYYPSSCSSSSSSYSCSGSCYCYCYFYCYCYCYCYYYYYYY